ncbi:TPA: hypothetical protein ACSVZR_003548 [Bacillus cereus]
MSKRETVKQIESIAEEINRVWGEIDLAENHDNQESYVANLYERIDWLTKEEDRLRLSL